MSQDAKKLIIKDLKFNYDDYLLLPEDGKRYEIIDGEIYSSSTPPTRHQSISAELSSKLWNHVCNYHLGIVYFGPLDVLFSNTDIVVPDLLFISKANRDILTKENIKGAPDLIAEITSLETKERDSVLKKKLYAKFGVKEYWIVFMQEEKIEVWKLEDSNFILDGVYEKDGVLKSSILSGLEIKLTEVFREIEDYFA